MEKRNIKKEKASNIFHNKNNTRLKTGLFKWNPDHLSAVGHFEDAGKQIQILILQQQKISNLPRLGIAVSILWNNAYYAMKN